MFAFDDFAASKRVLALPGRRFIWLRVAPFGADYQLPTMPPMRDRILAFCQALGVQTALP